MLSSAFSRSVSTLSSSSLRLAASRTTRFPTSASPAASRLLLSANNTLPHPRALSCLSSNTSRMELLTPKVSKERTRGTGLGSGLFFGGAAVLGGMMVLSESQHDTNHDGSPFSTLLTTNMSLCEEKKVKIVEVSNTCTEVVDVRDKESIPFLRKIIESEEEKKNPDMSFLGWIYLGHGEALLHNGDYKECLKELQKAREIFERTPTHTKELILCYVLMGRLLLETNCVPKAMEEFEKAERLMESELSDSLEYMARMYMFIGDALQKHGMLVHAIERYQEMEKIGKKEDSAELIPFARLRMGWALSEDGDSQGAVREYQKMLEISSLIEALGIAHVCIGWELQAKGDHQGAVREYQKAIDAHQTNRPESVELFRLYNAVGTFLLEVGDSTEALRLLNSSLEIVEKKDPDSLWEAVCRHDIGTALLAEGDFEGALRECRKALAIYESKAPGSLLAGRTHYAIGSALEGQGHSEEAIAEHTKASDILQSEGSYAVSSSHVIRELIQEMLLVDCPIVTLTRTVQCNKASS